MTKFEAYRDAIDVTSNHRPDLNWKFTDSLGHVHRWFVGEEPAVAYHPQPNYHVPTIKWVKTGTSVYPDGSEYEIGYHVCLECGDVVRPGYTADTTSQYVPGLTHYLIDGVEVSFEEWMQKYREAESEC